MEDNRLTNFLPVNRQLFDHPLWEEKRTYSKFEAWLDLLQSARFDDSEQKQIINNKLIKWNRGQLPASLRYLATRWDWSTKKVSTFLEMLKTEKMIILETPKETGQTIITLCKYETYNGVTGKKKQQKRQQGNSEETAGKQRGNESNIDNIDNNEKNEDTPALQPVSKQDQEKFSEFMGWIDKNAPTVNKLKIPFSLEEYLKLREKIPKEKVTELLLKMHNWKPLLKNNNSAYLTILNWYANPRNAETVSPESEGEKYLTESERLIEKQRLALQKKTSQNGTK